MNMDVLTPINADLAIASRDTIGEAPAWDARKGRLIWSDMEVGILHEAQSDGSAGWKETNCWNLGVPIAAAIPRRAGGLVIVAGVEISLMDDEGALTSFARIDADPERFRFNDAKCDEEGRLWAGTLSRDFEVGAAKLYCIHADGRIETALDEVTLANGLDWSPDGEIFYFVDSLARTLIAFDFNQTVGQLANPRTVLTLKRGEGGPNGLCVDREGAIWMAVTGSHEVRRYSPEGNLLATVRIGTPGATACAFGGADGRDLFITSLGRRMPEVARTIVGLSEVQMMNDGPGAGALYVCRPGVKGAPACLFAG